MSRQRKMILGAVVRGLPGCIAGWRHKDVSAETLKGSSGLDYYTHIAANFVSRRNCISCFSPTRRPSPT